MARFAFFRTLTLGLVLTGALFFLPRLTLAQTSVESGYQSILQNGIIFANICTADACPCRDFGQCSLDNVMQIFVNIATGILGIIGSIVLVMFVYGGFMWVTSEGRTDRVDTGKKTLTNAIIGLALVLGAYALMNFVIATVAGDRPGTTLEETIQNAQDNEDSLDNTTPSTP